MTGDLTRRDSLITALLASVPLAGDEPATSMLRSVAFVTTLAAARGHRFDSSIGVLILAGYDRPGDAGAGQVMVRDEAVDDARARARPTEMFLDRSGAGFSRAPDAAAAALRAGPVLDWLAARIDRIGVDPFAERTPGGGDLSGLLQRTFEASSRDDHTAPATTLLPRGHWPIGSAQVVLDGRHVSVAGQGITLTYLHSTVAAGGTAMTLRNYGGTTRDFGLDSGAPGGDPRAARQTARNGILFDWGGGHGTVKSVEARWFNGFGIRFVTIWDSVVENVVTVGCGNDVSHAIEFASVGDTTNHTNVNRIQVENSHGRALLFDVTCMNMCVDNIHCEGTIGKPGQYAASLLGQSMSYRNARFANNGGNVSVLLGGAGNVYDRFSFEKGTLVDYSTGALGRSERSFITHSAFDRLRVLPANRGLVVVSDCTIEHLEVSDQLRRASFVRCIIGTVGVRGNQTDVLFDDCDITGPWTSEGNPVVRVRHSRLGQGPAGASVFLDGCVIRDSYATSFNQQIVADDCEFGGDLTLDQNGARVWLSGRFRVAGNLRYQAGQAFGACGFDGVVGGSVHPNWYGTGGSWPAGTVRARPDASGGDSPFSRFDGRRWVASPALL